MSEQPDNNSPPIGIRGAVWSIVLAVPIAAIWSLIHRFPVPFFGYGTKVEHLAYVMGGAIAYLIMGGLIVLGCGGHFAQRIAASRYPKNSAGEYWLTVGLAGLVALGGVLSLAYLENIVGPW